MVLSGKIHGILTKPISTWHGVKLTDDGVHVEKLFLGFNQLKGALPNLNLPELGQLLLYDNHLTGVIPNFDLPKLTYTDLSGNQFSGEVPNFDLPNLETMYLDENLLSGKIPNFNLPNLTYLSLSRNQLGGIIPNFDLPKLETLNIQYNAFTFKSIASHLKIPQFFYEDQKNIPVYRDKSTENTLYLKAGGDIKDNTYYWYKYGVAYDTIVGDSVLVAKSPGTYYCKVTNSVVTRPQGLSQNLVLQSNQTVVNGNIKSILSVNQSDSLELIKLYKSTNGANWKHKWDLSKPLNTWYGVKLTEDKYRVKALYLSGNGLTGSIPRLDLPELEYLDFFNNKLTGYIINFKLPKLWFLDLAANELSGTIPNFDLPNLKTLRLFQNQLTGTIPNFDLIPNVEDIYISYNQLTGEIPNLNLLKLQYLTLFGNQLSGQIPNFENAQVLQELVLVNNQLSGPVPNLDHLSKLTNLDIRGNELTFQGIEENLNIRYFYYENQDTIPIYQNAERNELYVKAGGNIKENTYYWYKDGKEYKTIAGDSLFTATAPGTYYCKVTNSVITRADSLFDNLILQSAQTVVETATELMSCLKSDSLELIKLYKATNGANWTNKWDLFRPVSTWSGITLTKDGCRVAEIFLFSNNLVGSLVDLHLPLLTSLDLADNKLSGDIPNFNLPNLWFLGLSVNQLSRHIPNFDNLPNMENCALAGNKLTGTIPNFDKLPVLGELHLEDNQLSGNIPNFNNSPNLWFLDLSGNQLSGGIPNFNLPELMQLLLEDNQLSGSIPNFNLPKLMFLFLSNNQLSGAIPNFNRLTELVEFTINNFPANTIESNDVTSHGYYNAFTFEGIEENLFIQTFHYDNQDTIPIYQGEKNTLYVKAGGDIQKNTYYWYKDGTAYDTIAADSVLVVKEPGTYYCKVKNSVITIPIREYQDLVLQSKEVVVSPQNPILAISQSDSLELIKLYKATNGNDWQNKWDLSKPVSAWYGVKLTSDGSRVQGLYLKNNQLIGSISFLNLPELDELNLSANVLSGPIPNFDLLEGLDIRQNNFTFDGIEQNLIIPVFYYDDQNIIPIAYTMAKNELYVKAEGGVKNNTYNWYKDGKKYKTIKGDSVLIAKEPGTYYCKVTNSVVTRPYKKYQNLVLQSAQAVVNKKAIIDYPIPCLKHDSLELIKLYKAANGANWTNKWDLSKPVSTWHGIKLTTDRCNVQSINLANNKLSGTIPNFDLPNLKHLYLTGNQLSGHIPNFNLPELEDLYLFVNQLSGPIPNFNLPNLKGLWLSHNKLSGHIPNFNLPELTYLILTENQLSGGIPNFDKLLKLEALEIIENSFTFQGIAQHLNLRAFYYDYQQLIPIYQSAKGTLAKNKLYVKAGGDISKNTYYWYKDGTAYDTIAADSVLVVTEPGTYYCVVTNSVITRADKEYQNLVLQSYLKTISLETPHIEIFVPELPVGEGEPVSLGLRENKREIILFPNPAKENVSINIEGAKGKRVDIDVLDRFGGLQMTHLIQPLTNEVIELNVRPLSNGYYYVRILLEGKQAIVKPLIIAR